VECADQQDTGGAEDASCVECEDAEAWLPLPAHAPFAATAAARPRSLTAPASLAEPLPQPLSLRQLLTISAPPTLSLRFEGRPEVFLSRTDVKEGRGPWGKFVLFTIRVVDGRAWQLEKKFSQFVALDSELRKKYPGRMPPFPDLHHDWTDWARTTGSLAQKLKVCTSAFLVPA
jgi:hypothetical protein